LVTLPPSSYFKSNNLGSYAPTWIKLDPGSTGLGSIKLLIKSV